MKTQTIRLNLVEFTLTNGSSEINCMTTAQLAGYKKSKYKKQVLAKKKLAVIEIKVKHINKPF